MDTPATTIHTPRRIRLWVATWAWITVIFALLLIALGGFVTSFRVGMADPVWPTEPWFLFNNTNWQFGFVVEHTHRFAGWIVGFAITLLCFVIWNSEPDRRLRVIGFVALLGLLLAYGEFHRGFRGTFNQIKDLAKTQLNVDANATNIGVILKESRLSKKIDWPVPSILITILFIGFALYCGVRSFLAHKTDGLLRLLGIVSLIAVMIQGLLGGFRVLLDALSGANLAAIHGMFGQLAFCGLVAVAVLCTPRRVGDSLPGDERQPLAKLAWILVGTLVVQLAWAVLLRHNGSGIWQRLHMLTAFLASALIVWLVVRIFSTSARFLFGVFAWILVAILAAQLLLGVEAYLGKFAAFGKQAQVLPEGRLVTSGQATIRTLHQLIGCVLLGSSLALTIRLSRGAHSVDQPSLVREGAIPDFAMMAMTLRDNAPGQDGAMPDVAAMALVPPDDGALPEKAVPNVASIVMDPPEGLVR